MLQGAGFKVELGGAGHADERVGDVGSGKPVIAIVTVDGRVFPKGRKPREASRASRSSKECPATWKGHNVMAAVRCLGGSTPSKKHGAVQTPRNHCHFNWCCRRTGSMRRPVLVSGPGYFKDVDAAVPHA